MTRPVVYFARAMEGLDHDSLLAQGRSVATALRRHGMDLLDPVAVRGANTAGLPPRSVAAPLAEDPMAMVEYDLRHLRRSDGLLVDMSSPTHTYIGCVCELTYAYLWQIPAVVWVGRTGLEQRPWLRYHARAVVRGRDEALSTMAALLADAVPAY